MKFVDKYPNAQINQEFYVDGDAVFYSHLISVCCVCRVDNYNAQTGAKQKPHFALTRFYSVSFAGAPICSEECLAKFWSDLEEANKNANKLYGPPQF